MNKILLKTQIWYLGNIEMGCVSHLNNRASHLVPPGPASPDNEEEKRKEKHQHSRANQKVHHTMFSQ